MTQDQSATQRAMISAADPASGIPPLRDDQTIALAQQAVDAGERRAPARRPVRRSLIAGVVAAAAAVVVVGAAIAIPLANVPAQDPLTIEQVPGGIMAKCVEPTAETLAEYSDMLFRADVSAITDGVVTLRVTETITGEPGSVVEVAQGDGAVSDGGPLVFEQGATYLLATNDGLILSCGLSGVASPQLEGLYDDAASLQGR